MDSRWFKATPKNQREDRKKEVQSFRRAFEALEEILIHEFEETAPSYEHAAWAYEQADRNGANRKLRSIIKLLKTD